MTFRLKVLNKLRVPVRGAINNEDGVPVKFEFTLLCKRLNQTQVDAVVADKEGPIRDFLHDVTTGWEGVADAEGEAIGFSAATLDAVLEQPGMRAACFGAYLKEVGVASKN